jgi:hypothetical protein
MTKKLLVQSYSRKVSQRKLEHLREIMRGRSEGKGGDQFFTMHVWFNQHYRLSLAGH